MIGISFFTLLFKLVYKDSNLELQSQNLSCYHYTIDHRHLRGKDTTFFETDKIFSVVSSQQAVVCAQNGNSKLKTQHY